MLHFILHSQPKSQKSTQLLLQIEFRIERGSSTLQISGRKEEMYQKLRTNLVPAHLKNGEKALSLLLQEEVSFRRHEASLTEKGVTSLSRQKEESDPVTFFRVRPSSIYSTLETLSSLGMLFIGGQRMIFDRLSTPTGLQIAASHEGEKKVLLEISLYSSKTKKGTHIPSGKVGFIMSSPTLIAHGSLIQKIHESVSWKTLLPFIHGSTKALMDEESPEFRDWKKSAESDMCEEDSEFHLLTSSTSNSETSIEPSAPSQNKGPLPILRLHHSFGMTASLLMEYEHAGETSPRIVQYQPIPRLSSKVSFTRAVKEPWRKIDEEESWEKDLLDCGFSFTHDETSEGKYFCSSEKAQEALKTLLEIGWKLIDHMGRPIHLATHIDIELARDGESAYALKGALQTLLDGEQKTPFQELPLLFKELQKEPPRRQETNQTHRIVSCGTYSLFLPLKAYSSLQELASEIEISAGKAVLPSYKIGLIQDDEDREDDLISYLPPHSEKHITHTSSLTSLSFKGELYPYQKNGVQWLVEKAESKQSALLADEMGLGKTVQVLAWLSKMSFSKPVLIIVPKALLFNWEREIKRFLPDLVANDGLVAFHGTERQEHKNISDLVSKRIILTSFHIVRVEKEFLSSITYSALIIDEAQYIKNHQSLTYQAIASIPTNLYLILTGTPVENSLSDLWSHFHLIEKRLFKDRESFLLPFTLNSAPLQQKRALQKIKKLISPYTLRRTKKMVALDLPEIIDQTVWVEMEDEQKSRYHSFLASLKEGKVLKLFEEALASSKKDRRMKILEALLRLRQLSCHHELFQWQYQSAEKPTTAKWELVIEDIATLTSEGKKVVVFSQFASLIDRLHHECIERGILQENNLASYHGKSQKGSLEAAVDRFQNDPTTSCLFMTLKAGGVGINLTQADAVLLYDPWWNRAAEEQAIARAHRIGRKEPVMVKRYITQETIEERVWNIAEKKEALFNSLFSSTEEGEDMDAFEDSYDDFLEALLMDELYHT